MPCWMRDICCLGRMRQTPPSQRSRSVHCCANCARWAAGVGVCGGVRGAMAQPAAVGVGVLWCWWYCTNCTD